MFHVIHRTPMGIIREVDVNASTIQEAIDILDIPVNQYPTICIRNGQPVKRAFWKTIDHDVYDDHELETCAETNDKGNLLTFLTVPQGDFFKNILSLVATIALTVFAPWAAGFIAPLLGITSTLGLQLLQAGIVLAGSFLIGTFLGPTAPKINDSKGAQASPTYSLTGQGNQARLFEAIPKQYGKHMIYPDYAAQPYSEFIDNQQYLNQLFCLGLGEYQQHEMRIEDTAFWNEVDGYLDTYTGIDIEIIPPNGAVTLFHSQVLTSVEVGSQDIPMWSIDNTFQFTSVNKRILSLGADESESGQFRLAVIGQKIHVLTGANAGIYTINSIATDQTWIEVVEAISNATYFTTVQLDQNQNWIGPYVANTASTVTNKLQIDYVFPSGMFWTSDAGTLGPASATLRAEARLINTAGIPIGSYFLLSQDTYTFSTQTPQRITKTYSVSDGRYEVRVRRVDAESPSTRFRSAVQWNGLKAYIPNDNIYPDVTLLAIRMLATGQLTQTSSKKINVIQTAKLPIWDAGTETWSAPTVTRSIAWAAADIVRNPTYGANFSADYIDLEKLTELDETWENREDTFNAVFDSTYSVWEALTMCLRVGRTIPVMIGGKLTFVRDEPRTIPRGVFTPATMQKGSFTTRHILFDDESPDDIIIQFVDERTWEQNEVQATLDDSLSAKPERMNIFGITNRSQAWREGMFIAAVNSKRRVIANFTSEMEGRLLMRGDMVSIAHDLYDWGQTGQVEGYDFFTRTVWLSESMDWSGLTESYLLLRKRNGVAWGPVKINQGDDSYQVIVNGTDLLLVEAAQGPIVNTFNMDTDSQLTTYIICEQTLSYKDFIVAAGSPKDEVVDLTCILEDPAVHEADQGPVPPEQYPFGTTPDNSRPVIAFLAASEDTTSDPNYPSITFAWGASTTATEYRLQISYDNATWETIYAGPNLVFVGSVFAGPLFVRVQGFNTQAGPWKTFSGVFGTGSMTPLPITSMSYDYSVNAGYLSAEWPSAIRATSYRIAVYKETTPGSGIFDDEVLTRTQIGTSITFTSGEITAVGGPWSAVAIGVTSINSIGESSEVTEQIAGITLDPVTGLSLQAPYNRATFVAQWNPTSANSFTVEIFVDGVLKLTYSTLTNTQSISTADMTAVGGPWRQLQVRVTAVAGILTSTPVNLLVTAPTVLPVTGAGGVVTGTSPSATITLNCNQTPDNGVNQVRLRYNTTNNFGTSTIINTQTKAAGAAYSYPHTPKSSGTYYYWLTAYDSVLAIESTAVLVTATVP